MEVGAILTMQQVWHLSQRWYAPRLDIDYTGRSTQQVRDIFTTIGLTGPFWKLPNEL